MFRLTTYELLKGAYGFAEKTKWRVHKQYRTSETVPARQFHLQLGLSLHDVPPTDQANARARCDVNLFQYFDPRREKSQVEIVDRFLSQD